MPDVHAWGVQEDVPQPPADELLALQELHAARKVLQAQALRESRKVGRLWYLGLHTVLLGHKPGD